MSNRYSDLTLKELYDAAKSSSNPPFYIGEEDKFLKKNSGLEDAKTIQIKASKKMYEATTDLRIAINTCKESLQISGDNPIISVLDSIYQKMYQLYENIEIIQTNNNNFEINLSYFDDAVADDLEKWYQKYYSAYNSASESQISNVEEPQKSVAYHDGVYGVNYCVYCGDFFSNSFQKYEKNPELELSDNQEANAAMTNTATNKPVTTITSGQMVKLNGEVCYFVMQDYWGKVYYTKGLTKDAIIYTLDNGKLVEYTVPGSSRTTSRESFVNDRKNNVECYWTIQYNGDTPYESIGEVYTAFVTNPKYNNSVVTFSKNYVDNNSVSLSEVNRELEKSSIPYIIFVDKNQKIKCHYGGLKSDNTITGGNNGCYLVYDSSVGGYYVIDSQNLSYRTNKNGMGSFIYASDLFSNKTTIDLGGQ